MELNLWIMIRNIVAGDVIRSDRFFKRLLQNFERGWYNYTVMMLP